LSDKDYYFSSAMKLPMLNIGDLHLIKRLTLIVKDGVIKKYFYPVFPPNKSANEVINWLSVHQIM
jgi:peroxiredoxin